MPSVIGGLKGELTKLLGDTFDPDSKTSALAKIEAVLDGSSDQLARSIRATFSLDQPDSPLTRTKREMTEVIQREVGTVLNEVRTLQQSMVANAAVAEVSEKLTAKGVGFEALIAIGLAPFAGVHGDVIEATGRNVGSAGTLKGDLLITLCDDDTGGQSARFVIEAKDQRLSMTKTLAELDAALANHDAGAAIAVFASENQAPIALPFWYSGNRAILIYDKHDPEPRGLQLAYEWARWVCRRARTNVEPQLDLDAVMAAVERARQALRRHQTVKACHSAIKKKADEAGGHVADLVGDINQAVEELLAILRDVGDTAA